MLSCQARKLGTLLAFHVTHHHICNLLVVRRRCFRAKWQRDRDPLQDESIIKHDDGAVKLAPHRDRTLSAVRRRIELKDQMQQSFISRLPPISADPSFRWKGVPGFGETLPRGVVGNGREPALSLGPWEENRKWKTDVLQIFCMKQAQNPSINDSTKWPQAPASLRFKRWKDEIYTQNRLTPNKLCVLLTLCVDLCGLYFVTRWRPSGS